MLTKSQDRIRKLLDESWKGRSTLITVAHRLDTIRGYDKIAVMKDGKIVELGNYDELIRKKGSFYQLAEGRKQDGE